MLGFVIVVMAIMVVTDLYAFKGVRLLTGKLENSSLRLGIHLAYWGVTIFLATWLLITPFRTFGQAEYKWFFMFFGIFLMTFLPKLLFVVFHLLEDIVHLVRWLFASKPSGNDGEGISRLAFLTQTGAVLATIPLVSVGYGILKGRFDFRVVREQLSFTNLPKAFDGLKVVQISDLHIGSFFGNHAAVQKGIDMINELEPDLILFTGDMVNNTAAELDGWVPVLSKLKARMGKYSVLGNHDYGDYTGWPSEEAKRENLNTLVRLQRDMGFDVLLDENRTIEKDGQQFSLLGIQNWGSGGFAKYGNLETTMRGSNKQGFQLLMSHDPSHWDEQVLNKTDIDLALAGHTHGSQFGVKIAGREWSPVSFRYKRWGGLYQEGKQRLYVNRGFGYIGFPGRVGMPPEITLLELHSA